MNFTVLDVEQRSEAWARAKLGRLSGSRASDMLAEGRNKGKDKGHEEAVGRLKLRVQLMLERVTGVPQGRSYVSRAMQYGADTEREAFNAYQAITGRLLRRTGFLQHNELMAGCSLDGDISCFSGIVEIKCPDSHTHWEYLRTGKVPTDYYRQITHNLWISGARWCDWMSFDSSFPGALRAKVVRIERNEEEIAEYESKARAFLAEVDRDVLVLRTMADLSTVLTEAAA